MDIRAPQESKSHLADISADYPISLKKAALPILAGAAGLVLRAGWKLLQSKTAREVALDTAHTILRSNVEKRSSGALNNALTNRSNNPTAGKPRRTIRINSRWAVGDQNGILRQGQSEHIIEIDLE